MRADLVVTDWQATTDLGANQRAPKASGGRLALYTSIDQALSSLSNALLLFAVAQTATVTQFGVVTLLVAVVNTVMGFNRGALGTPVLLVSNLRLDEIRTESGYAVTWAAASGVGTAMTLSIVGAMTGSITTAITFSLAAPAILIQDVLRLSALSCGRPLMAVASDGIWALLMAVLYLVNVMTRIVPIGLVVLLWGIGGLVSGVLLSVATGIRPRFHRIWQWWRTYDAARMRFGWVQALIPISTAVFILGITLILGSAVAGGLRGASTLFGPIAMLISALPLAFVPHARRSNKSVGQQWQLLVKTAWATSMITMAGTVCLIALPTHLGRLLLGDIWGPAVAVVPYVGFEAAANCWMVCVYALTQTQGRSGASLWLRILQVALKLGASVAAAFAFGTAIGVAAGSALAAWLSVVVSLTFSRRLVRKSASGGVVRP
jgi:O-antigen/teichoic acid export membrane protein